MRENNWIWER